MRCHRFYHPLEVREEVGEMVKFLQRSSLYQFVRTKGLNNCLTLLPGHRDYNFEQFAAGAVFSPLKKEAILKEVPGANIRVMQLDLGALESVENFASEFK